MSPLPHRLDSAALHRGVRFLARIDRDLAAVVKRHGPPPLWARRPGTPTLIGIILEQQVSLASARAIWRRLEASLGTVSAETILAAGEDGLRRIGLTRQKAAHCTELSRQVTEGGLNLRRVARLPAHDARAELMRVKGIGPWSADIYLLMALRRPDIWPMGDIALLTALQRLRRLSLRPTADEAEAHANRWTPWRAVAARILWHGYLEGSLRRVTSARNGT